MIRTVIHINEELCSGCGLCASACKEGAIAMVNGKARLIRDDYCDGLGNCLPACPVGAISFVQREAAAFDEEAVKEHLARKQQVSSCPGMKVRAMKRAAANESAENADNGSQLRQWPVQIRLAPPTAAFYQGADLLIVDTAGRLHIDQELMDELVRIKENVHPQEILLVVDAMTGQDAVNVAQTFNEKLDIDGVILTKLDGDTRGGAALSVRAVTGKPIKFSGTGEKLSEIEPFHPDRMASRILGMGDVLTLIDKASEAFDQEDAEKLAKKARTADLTLDDFLDQMQSMKKMGGIKSMLEMLPGMSGKDIDVDENAMKKPEAIIRSMTPKERRNPGVLNASRRKRIAAGSGTTVQDVNQLIRQFDQAKQMMKQVTQMKGKGRMRMRFPGMR